MGDVAGALRRRGRLAVAVALATFAAAAGLSVLLPRSFESYTKVRVVDNRALQDVYGARLAGSGDATERIRAIHEEILSRANLEETVKELGLDRGIDRLGSRRQMEEREAIIRDLVRSTRIDLLETTRGQFIFRISNRSATPLLAQRVVSALSTGYQERLYAAQKATAGEALGTIRTKIASLEAEYRSATDALSEFEERCAVHRFGQPDDTRARYSTEEEQVRTVRLEADALTAQLADVRQRLEAEPEYVEVDEEVSKEPVVARIREEIRLAEEVLASLRQKLTDEHPDVQAQLRRIEQKQQALAEESTRDSRTKRREQNGARIALSKAEWELCGSINVKRRMLADHEERLRELSELLPRYAELKKEWENLVDRKVALRSQLSGLRDQEESAKTAWQAKMAESTLIFEILDPPAYPLEPVSPSPLLITVVAVVLACGVAAGIVFLVEAVDSTYRKAEEVARETGLAVLGTIGVIETRAERVLTRRRRVVLRACGALLGASALAIWFFQFAYGGEIHAWILESLG